MLSGGQGVIELDLSCCGLPFEWAIMGCAGNVNLPEYWKVDRDRVIDEGR